MEQLPVNNRIDTHRIDVLDGVRAFSILIVVWYHFWQQSWLAPVLRLPDALARVLGTGTISFDIIPRTGYLLVDMMLLLSAFCLFLPHARAMLSGEPVPGTLSFYKKRLVRILPPYLLCVFALFSYAALSGQYGSAGEALRDLFANLTFTQTLSPDTYFYTKINGVLWTAAIEMQFYLIFPLLAYAFRKQPVIAYLGLVLAAAVYTRGYALPSGDARFLVNQLPAFLGVFANGMLGAYLFVAVAKHFPRCAAVSVPATLLAGLSLLLINRFQHMAVVASDVQAFQLAMRYPLSLAFLLFILASALSARWLRLLLGNPLTRFFAAISYNLYIWHQWLAIRLKEWRIPYWTGERLPNLTGNRVWQTRYTLICFVAAIALAALLTYCFERPAVRLLTRGRITKKTTTEESPS